MGTEAKRTPYYQNHVAGGAKIVEFAGFWMPIQYHSITAEHLRVRRTVGIFDLSHMGEFVVSGKDALSFLQRVTVNDVAALGEGQVQYSCMCYPDGGIVDDLLVYNRGDHYFLVVNAACLDKDFAWLQSRLSGDVRLENISDEIGLLAIQGPHAEKVMARLTDCPLDQLKFYWSVEGEVAGTRLLFSRTGYTGEDGFEIYHPPHLADRLWKAVLAAGREFEIEPIGLGARDSLRLEMKYMLYGNDIDRTTNPIEAGLSWIIRTEKGDFVGREPIVHMKEVKPKRRLVCFQVADKAIPRHGYKLFKNATEVGQVTSGNYSPCLESGIGLGYVPSEFGSIGGTVDVQMRGRFFPATIVKPPFYKEFTHK